MMGAGFLAAQNLPHLWQTESSYFQQVFDAVGEPILGDADSELAQKDAYRFTYYRSLDPLILFRLQEQTEGNYTLITTQLNGERPPSMRKEQFVVYDGMRYDSTDKHFFQLYRPVEVTEQTETAVSQKQVEDLLSVLKYDDFMHAESLGKGEGGKDGSVWIFEAWQGGQYHFVARKNPNTPIDDWFRSMCMRLIEISGLEIEYLY